MSAHKDHFDSQGFHTDVDAARGEAEDFQAGEPPRAEETPLVEHFRPWLERQLERCRDREVNDNTKKSREYHGNMRIVLHGILSEYDRRQAAEITALRQQVKELQERLVREQNTRVESIGWYEQERRSLRERAEEAEAEAYTRYQQSRRGEKP